MCDESIYSFTLTLEFRIEKIAFVSLEIFDQLATEEWWNSKALLLQTKRKLKFCPAKQVFVEIVYSFKVISWYAFENNFFFSAGVNLKDLRSNFGL